MKFYKTNIDNLVQMLDKMQRYYAYKYEMPKGDIAFVIKGQVINVMVQGKLTESVLPSTLIHLFIDEETGSVKKISA